MRCLVIMILVPFLLGCDGLKRINNNQNLNEENYQKLSGTYSIFHGIYSERESKRILLDTPDFLESYSIPKEDENGDSIDMKEVYAAVSFPSRYKLRIDFVNNQADTIQSSEFDISFKKNGMIRVGKDGKCKGVPFIYLRCKRNQTEIGLSTNGEFILNEFNENTTMVFVFGAGSSFPSTYYFHLIE